MNDNINLPPFYSGQRVVCVEKNNDSKINTILNEEISLGKEYVVTECEWLVLLSCSYWYVKVSGMRTKWDSKSFTSIEENFQSISLEKVLELETPLIGVN